MLRIDAGKVYDLSDIEFGASSSGTTGGILPKAVTKMAGKTIYLKAGAYTPETHEVYGQEPIMEVLNSRVGKALGINVLEYSLIRAQISVRGSLIETLVCVSRDFGAGYDERYTAEKLCRTYGIDGETRLETMRKLLGPKEISKMFVYDFIIGNLDRHGANIEVLRKGKSLTLAPLFDSSLTRVGINFEAVSNGGLLPAQELTRANNFLGSPYLENNVKAIRSNICLRKLTDKDREKIYQGLGTVTTKKFRDYFWNMILEHTRYVQNECKTIQWR